jgi:hypothetical protein
MRNWQRNCQSVGRLLALACVVALGAVSVAGGAVPAGAAGSGDGKAADPGIRGTTARLPVAVGAAEEPGQDFDRDLATEKTHGLPANEAPQQPASALGASPRELGWELVDVDSFLTYLPVGQACAVRFDNAAGTLEVITPGSPLTALALQAIEYAPDWLALDLRDAFGRMNATRQDLYAGIVIGAEDPIVDEIAFVVAHTAPEVLESGSFHTELLTENAQSVYAHDSSLAYVDVIDYGSAASGGDYYSTLRYRTAAAGETLEVELPRDRYYWDVVHPKITDEFPTYIDPATGAYADPPAGKFWRDFLFAYADSGYPVLRDQLAGCLTLWEGNVDSRTNGAVGIITQWILDVMDFGSGAERPIQPVRIYHKHLGRCGEHADITAAASRAALIPTNSAATMENDHTWNEFWDRRWIAWEPVNVYIDAPWHYEGWGSWQFLGAFDWRGDDGIWTVTERYTPACTLTVAVTDSAGHPIDGAQVTIARKISTVIYYESTWASTDHTGTCTFPLGDGQAVYARIDSDLGTVPPGPLFKLVVDPTVAGAHYTWTKMLANPRPSLPALPMSPPVDTDVEYQIRVTWQAADEFVSGTNRIDDNTFSDHLTSGAVASFVCDSANYAAYAAADTFWAYEIDKDVASGDLVFDVPTGDGYYVVLSNEEHVVASQVVRGVAELYYRPVAAVADRAGASAEAALGQNRPNPVTSQTTISFAVPDETPVNLSVYDVEGRCVRTLVSGKTAAGEHRVTWDGCDSRGRHVAPGVYLYRLVTPDAGISRKMAIIE